jgi:hypothetical protein
VTALRHLEQRDEHHDTDAVVEQRLAGDLGLEIPRDTCTPEDPQDRNGIGGRDQRAEKQTVDQRHVQSQPTEQRGRRQSDQNGGDEHADGREQRHGPLLLPQVPEVHEQRPREQQKAQHPVQQRLAEIDALHERSGVSLHARCQPELGQGEERRRSDQRNEHQPDGRGQAQIAVVQIAERRGQRQKHRNDVEQAHRGRDTPPRAGWP